VPALNHDVDERIGDGRDTGLLHERQELRDVVIVHGVHGGQVRSSHASAEAEALRLEGERLDVT
jgi:hypothetical protein